MKNSKVENLGALGKQISDATILMHEAIAKNVGLTGVDHKYLSIILKKAPLTAGELSKLTGLTTGAVTGVIDRLEKRKLVFRTSDKTDRRKILITPNIEKSKKLFENSHLDLKSQIENLINTFNDIEIDAIKKYLTASIEIMNEITKKLNNK